MDVINEEIIKQSNWLHSSTYSLNELHDICRYTIIVEVTQRAYYVILLSTYTNIMKDDKDIVLIQWCRQDIMADRLKLTKDPRLILHH